MRTAIGPYHESARDRRWAGAVAARSAPGDTTHAIIIILTREMLAGLAELDDAVIGSDHVDTLGMLATAMAGTVEAIRQAAGQP
jgi:hypothetical protein